MIVIVIVIVIVVMRMVVRAVVVCPVSPCRCSHCQILPTSSPSTTFITPRRSSLRRYRAADPFASATAVGAGRSAPVVFHSGRLLAASTHSLNACSLTTRMAIGMKA
jgi:hypothetical protein